MSKLHAGIDNFSQFDISTNNLWLKTNRDKIINIIHMSIYPQPVRRHYHPKYTLITLAPVSYLRSLVVRAVHRHRTGVGSIPAGGPIVDEFFSTVPG